MKCPRCAFRLDRCLCRELAPIETRTRLVLLQHAKDARRSTNTGRLLAALCPGAEVLPYGMPGDVLDIPELASRADSAVLFPKDESAELAPFPAGAPAPTLIILDGTWSQGARLARRLMKAGARTVRLPPGPPGAYRLRDSGDPTRVCTLEAAARALRALGETRAADHLEARFAIWVEHHLAARGRSVKGHA